MLLQQQEVWLFGILKQVKPMPNFDTVQLELYDGYGDGVFCNNFVLGRTWGLSGLIWATWAAARRNEH